MTQSRASGASEALVDERMAEGLCRTITQYFPQASRVAILAGGGGNGRQGQALARHYQRTAIEATVLVPDTNGSLESLQDYDVLVDALVGTGLHGSLSPEYRRLTDLAGASRRPIVAIDGPTGLDLDRGSVVDGALRANYTVFCGAPKIGGLTGAGREFCGEVSTLDLGIPRTICAPRAFVPSGSEIRSLAPVRTRDTHKGAVGTVAILGGDAGMPGAVRLAGSAAYRVGAGLVIAGVHNHNAAVLAAVFPELMAFTALSIEMPLGRAQWLLVGSGLGRAEWGSEVWAAARACGKPLLVDGDGLYWLARKPEWRADWILTPHEGEAARLHGVTC
ncbi:MAG: NAD(P)H-hydrate dehydratase, partial [Acidiferrobacter sp.]